MQPWRACSEFWFKCTTIWLIMQLYYINPAHRNIHVYIYLYLTKRLLWVPFYFSTICGARKLLCQRISFGPSGTGSSVKKCAAPGPLYATVSWLIRLFCLLFESVSLPLVQACCLFHGFWEYIGCSVCRIIAACLRVIICAGMAENTVCGPYSPLLPEVKNNSGRKRGTLNLKNPFWV